MASSAAFLLIKSSTWHVRTFMNQQSKQPFF
jgi:hypothetical protein